MEGGVVRSTAWAILSGSRRITESSGCRCGRHVRGCRLKPNFDLEYVRFEGLSLPSYCWRQTIMDQVSKRPATPGKLFTGQSSQARS